MNVKMDDDGAFRWINQMLLNIPASIQEQERPLLREAGKILKNNVKTVMRRSDVEEAAVKVEPKTMMAAGHMYICRMMFLIK